MLPWYGLYLGKEGKHTDLNLIRKIIHKPPEAARTLGRNELCWCGSGKKYKKCHYDADQNYFARKHGEECSVST